MTEKIYVGDHTERLLEIAHKQYPAATELTHIDHGYENGVIIIGSTAVLRAPRDAEVYKRWALERYVVTHFSSPLIPRILSENDNPPYAFYSLLPGKHFTESSILEASEDEQTRVGEQLGRFIAGLHASLSTEAIAAIQAKLPKPEDDESFADYLERTLLRYTLPTKEQDALAKGYYKLWRERKEPKTVVVHDDLHVSNLLFDEHLNLSGVLDFASVCVGTPEQEFRQLYRLGEVVFETAIKAYYEKIGYSVDAEIAKSWVITQELAAYAQGLIANKQDSLWFKRAERHLKRWFPDLF